MVILFPSALWCLLHCLVWILKGEDQKKKPVKNPDLYVLSQNFFLNTLLAISSDFS